jgi:hypothetical protein
MTSLLEVLSTHDTHVEASLTMSGSTEADIIVWAFKAMLNSELGQSRPKIRVQSVAFPHQEMSSTQLAIGPTQKELRSGNRNSTPILPNNHMEIWETGRADPANQSQLPEVY